MNRSALLCIFLLSAVCIAAEQKPKSLEERVNDLKRELGETEPSQQEREQRRKELQRDLEEIKALGLPDRALTEFRSRNPKATVKEWSAGYFRTKEVVTMSIIYSDPSAKRAQQELGFQKKGKKWEIFWSPPSVLEKNG